MSAFDDDFRRSFLQHQALLNQKQGLSDLNTSWEQTKAMLEGWERQRRLTLGPFADLLDSQRQYREARDRMIAGSTMSQLGGTADVLEAARKSLVANDISREAAHWSALRNELLRAATRPEIGRLCQTSAFEWRGQLGRLTTALDAAARLRAGWIPAAGLTETFAAPAFAYSRFSRQTIAMLPNASALDASALEASLALADQQVMAATSLAVRIIESASASSGAGDAEPGALALDGGPLLMSVHDRPALTVDEVALETNASSITLFGAQQAELVTAGVSSDAEYDAILGISPSARGAGLALGLIGTLLEIQQALLIAGAPEIFSRTYAATKGIVTLLCLHVHDEMTLGVAVDALYFMVYEASGEMKRITPILAEPLCEPVWRLKHLRNTWLRHDPQHGKEGEQKKKFAALREALVYFGSPAKPRAPAEFAALYETLLNRMGAFADDLFTAVLATHSGP